MSSIPLEKRREYNRAYYRKHRETLLQQKREYFQRVKETRRVQLRENGRKSRIKNRAKLVAWNRAYYQQHKDAYYRRHISYRYGLAPEAYIVLLEAAGYKCQICSKPLSSGGAAPCIDHNHDTGDIRGILCKICNVHLSWFEKHSQEASLYLGKSEA